MSSPMEANTSKTPTGNDMNGNSPSDTASSKPSAPRKWLSKSSALWAKTGIDLRTYQNMFKGALAPTIAIAAFQANAYASFFTTIGYLVAVGSILAIPAQPRAKFLQTMLYNLIFLFLASASSLLAMYCAVKARQHTSEQASEFGGPGTSGLASANAPTTRYNSSASAVAGVWLFFLVWMISTIRAKMPQFTIPGIHASTVINVSMIYAPQFPTIEIAENFVRRLLLAYLSGFGIATGVSLFIFPWTSRTIVFKEMSEYVSALRETLAANMTYLHSLEEIDMFARQRTNTFGEKPERSPEAQAIKEKVAALSSIHSQLDTDRTFAKREVAFLGKVSPDSIENVYKLLRLIMVPMIGLSCVSDIFQRISVERGWYHNAPDGNVSFEDLDDPKQYARAKAVDEWHDLMRMVRQPFRHISGIIDQGLDHALISLELLSKRKRNRKSNDLETKGDLPRPGDEGFSSYLRRETDAFHHNRRQLLTEWCRLHDIGIPPDFFEHPNTTNFTAPAWMNEDVGSETRQRYRRQLYILLYMEFLFFSISRAVYDLIVYAEDLKKSGKMDRNRIIVPGLKRLRKWVRGTFVTDDDPSNNEEIDTEGSRPTVRLGAAYKERRNPEHLPAKNAWERFGNRLRGIAHILESPASAFGFRSAAAVMSIAIASLLSDTQVFYTRQRLFWSQIMIAISMSPSAGQSLRNFLLRVFGTLVAVILCFVAYYIVNGSPAGVLVFTFIFLHAGSYIILRYPQWTPIGIVGQITIVVVIGYELQVNQLGVQVAVSNGQAYYPVYILAPIRLATVCAGLLLAFFWTIFPYPISEHSQLRKGLGSSLYLLANSYSVMHETIRTRIRGVEGDTKVKNSPGRKLEKSRNSLFAKSNIVIQGLRAQISFVKYDLPIGGAFPRQQYEKIIDHLQSIHNFMSLVSYASKDFTALQQRGKDSESQSAWLSDFRRLIGEANVTSQSVTTLLILLSSAINNGQPLPPYLRIPEPYLLSKRLEEMDRDILSVRHIAEPGYACFAVLQIGTKCIIDDLKGLLAGVKELVGELDFSYHVVEGEEGEKHLSQETLVFSDGRGKGKAD
ncbi:hypothetical protein MBLNU230_g0014t1 [Neophaeotheca triangularis]